MLAGHQEGEEESRGRLAFEASFDDSAEGERLHRYQARWGRSLLRTLAALEELRGRDMAGWVTRRRRRLPRGQDSDPAIPFIEETRLESQQSGNSLLTASSWVAGAGSPSALDDRSGASLRSSPATLVVSNTVMGCQKTSADLPCPTGGRDMNEAPAESVEAHPVEETETERGHDRVAADDQPIRRKEKRQNKPTAATRTLVKKVKMEPCALRPVASKATMAHSPCRESHQAGHGVRTQRCTSGRSDRTRMAHAHQTASEGQAGHGDQTKNVSGCQSGVLRSCQQNARAIDP